MSNVANLRVFGCVAFVHIPVNQRKKLEAKSREAIFVGYPEGTKGKKLYDPYSRSFIRSRDVVFLETKFHDFGSEQSTKSCFDYPPEDDVQVEVKDVPAVDERNDDHKRLKK